jgi:hypothetical protein
MNSSSDGLIPRLFLGGPAHGRRIPVLSGSDGFTVPVRPVKIWQPEGEVVEPPQVTYRLRRAPGTGEKVFVAPDYTYDTPEWLAFDTEAWPSRHWPNVTDWEHLGPWFWRGRPPETDYFGGGWRYVLVEKSGERGVSQLVDEFMASDFTGDLNEMIRREMQLEIDYQMLPTCLVPDCEKKARAALRAEERGKLAGRLWRVGEEILLCPEHSYDVLRAQSTFGPEHLADWLKPDARVSQEEHFVTGDALVFDTSRSRWAQVLRTSRKLDNDNGTAVRT